MDENAVSAIHRFPYPLFFFHLRRSSVCNATSLFLTLLFLDEMVEFFLLTLIPGRIFFSCRYLKFPLLSWAPSSKTVLMLTAALFCFNMPSTNLHIIFPSCTFSSVTSKARISLVFTFTATCILRWPFLLTNHLSLSHWPLFVTLMPVLSIAMVTSSDSLISPSLSQIFNLFILLHICCSWHGWFGRIRLPATLMIPS